MIDKLCNILQNIKIINKCLPFCTEWLIVFKRFLPEKVATSKFFVIHVMYRTKICHAFTTCDLELDDVSGIAVFDPLI